MRLRCDRHHLQGHALAGEDGQGRQLAHAQVDERPAQDAAVDVLNLLAARSAFGTGAPTPSTGKKK